MNQNSPNRPGNGPSSDDPGSRGVSSPGSSESADRAEYCVSVDGWPAHDWTEAYYGYRCRRCDLFIPYGCEPWMPTEEELGRR